MPPKKAAVKKAPVAKKAPAPKAAAPVEAKPVEKIVEPVAAPPAPVVAQASEPK